MLDRLAQLREQLRGADVRKRGESCRSRWRTASHSGNQLPGLLKRGLVELVLRNFHDVFSSINRSADLTDHRFEAVYKLECCLELESLWTDPVRRVHKSGKDLRFALEL